MLGHKAYISGWFSVQKSLDVICHINSLKKENDIVAMDA